MPRAKQQLQYFPKSTSASNTTVPYFNIIGGSPAHVHRPRHCVDSPQLPSRTPPLVPSDAGGDV